MKKLTTDNLAFAGYSQTLTYGIILKTAKLLAAVLDKNQELEVVDFCNQF
jgi:hypothetical protein